MINTNVVAVTGGIGSGKSRLVRNLAKLGYETHDMDKIVKEVYAMPHGKAFVQDEVPTALLRDGVNFPTLADVLFNKGNRQYEPTRLGRFEKFFVDEALKILRERVRSSPNQAPVYVECSMLFEHIQKRLIHKLVFDYIINVSCPAEKRLDRACFRDRTDPEIIKAKMDKQWTESDRLVEADLTVPNGSDDPDDLWVSTFKVVQYHQSLTYKRKSQDIFGRPV